MKTNNYTFIFLSSGKKFITATFKTGQQVNFTTDVLTLLLSDPAVDMITETETGNVLYYR